MSCYRVRHTKKYLKHLCEELIYGVKIGRDKFFSNTEGLDELKKYKESIYIKKYNLSNDERTDLDLALEWIVSVYIDFLEGKVPGDLIPPLSLAEIAIRDEKNSHLFRWEEMKDSETVYIKRKNGFISTTNSKVKFKY